MTGQSRLATLLMAPVKVDPDKVHEFQDADDLLRLARQASRHRRRSLDQDPQGRFRAEVDHAEASHRRRAVLGLDRRGAQGPRRQELSAALHAARQEKHLEPDQCRQCRPPDRRRPHDRAWAESRSKRPRPTAAGTRAYGSGKDMKIPDDLQAAIDAEPKAKEMLGKAQRAEPFRARLPHPQHEDRSRPQEEDRDLRRDAEARRDDPPAGEEVIFEPGGAGFEKQATAVEPLRGTFLVPSPQKEIPDEPRSRKSRRSVIRRFPHGRSIGDRSPPALTSLWTAGTTGGLGDIAPVQKCRCGRSRRFLGRQRSKQANPAGSGGEGN